MRLNSYPPENHPDHGDRRLQLIGTLTWHVTGYSETCDAATIEITETFDGEYTESDRMSGDILLTEQRTWTETYAARFEDDRFIFEEYLDPFGGSFGRFRPVQSESVVSMEFNRTVGSVAEYFSVIFEKGVGLREVLDRRTDGDLHRSREMSLIQ